MKHLSRIAGIACLTLLATPVPSVLAAPFCLSSQTIQPLCIYNDPQECAAEATRQQAVCTTNEAQLQVRVGSGKFCVVTSSGVANCIYPDRGTCDQEASRMHGFCSNSSPNNDSQVADPYSSVNGY
jgi:hypothetical protein